MLRMESAREGGRESCSLLLPLGVCTEAGDIVGEDGVTSGSDNEERVQSEVNERNGAQSLGRSIYKNPLPLMRPMPSRWDEHVVIGRKSHVDVP